MPPLFGHKHQQGVLEERLRQGNLAHAYVFTGPKGVGKRAMAERFAYACLKGQTFLDVCETDRVWQRLKAQTHGNYRLIERQPQDTGKMARDITIDAIRSVVSFFSQSAFEPGWRVVIIDSADELNRQGANSLLKILEEPPQKSVLILINHSQGKLLPTLRSRTQQLAFSPLDDTIMADLCQTYGWPQDFIPLAQGSPGILRSFSQLFKPQVLLDFEKALDPKGGQGVVAFVESLMAQVDTSDELLGSFYLLCSAWFAHQLRCKAQGIPCHRLYEGVPLGNLIARWAPLDQLFQESSRAYLDLKQTLVLAFQVLDPRYSLLAPSLTPWQNHQSQS